MSYLYEDYFEVIDKLMEIYNSVNEIIGFLKCHGVVRDMLCEVSDTLERCISTILFELYINDHVKIIKPSDDDDGS